MDEALERKVSELRELLAKATPGHWELQDGCSWRRIGTREHDGNVLCPSVYSSTDSHPDLTAGRGEDIYANLRLIVTAINALPSLLDALSTSSLEDGWQAAALEERSRIIEWLRCRKEFLPAIYADWGDNWADAIERADHITSMGKRGEG